MRISTAQAARICMRCFWRLRSRCGAVRIFGHGGDFSWWAQGKPHVLVLHSRLFVTIGAVLLRSIVFVAGAALWTWR